MALALQGGLGANGGAASTASFWLPTANTGAKIETLPNRTAATDLAAPASGTLILYALPVPLQAGVTYTGIAVQSGTTALATGTHQWFALVQASNLAFLRSTADDTSTAWAAHSLKRLFFMRKVTDAAITSGQPTLTSATAGFTAADTGQQCIVIGAGAAAAPLGSSASAVTMTFVNSTTVTLSANAGTTVSGGTAYIGTPYTPASSISVYVGSMVAATTLQSLAGFLVLSANLTNLTPTLAGTSTTAMTLPVADGTTAGAMTAQRGIPYAYVD